LYYYGNIYEKYFYKEGIKESKYIFGTMKTGMFMKNTCIKMAKKIENIFCIM
jgi:hypothetical protein